MKQYEYRRNGGDWQRADKRSWPHIIEVMDIMSASCMSIDAKQGKYDFRQV